MTGEEAIRILDPETTGEALAEIEYYNGFNGKTAAVQAVSDACVLAVSALREQEERRWIPVTERFPEHGDVVLCFMKFGEQRMLQWDNVASWWLGYGHCDDWQKADVTHWMPLPEPPVEDEK